MNVIRNNFEQILKYENVINIRTQLSNNDLKMNELTKSRDIYEGSIIKRTGNNRC